MTAAFRSGCRPCGSAPLLRTIARANGIAVANDRLATWAVWKALGWQDTHPDWPDACQFVRLKLVRLSRDWDPARGAWEKYAGTPLVREVRRFYRAWRRHGLNGKTGSSRGLTPAAVGRLRRALGDGWAD
jgi:hypothetical protein